MVTPTQRSVSSLKSWNEEEHLRLLNRGELKYEVRENDIYIIKRVSAEPDFGTASMRHIVHLSLNLRRGGHVSNQASWSSHFFHLYMGMIPNDYEVEYIRVRWGTFGMDAIQALPEIVSLLEKGKQLSEEQQSNLSYVKIMLKKEQGIEKTEITDQEVLENQKELYQLKEKTLSYVTHIFMDKILFTLERNPDKLKPDTSSFGSENMVLSEEGIQRWKEAIIEKKAFAPFKRLEHLHSKMTPLQRERLDKILLIREKNLTYKRADQS